MSSATAIATRLGRPVKALERYKPGRIPRASGARAGFGIDKEWDSDRAIREGLKVCSTLATCVTRIAEKGASVPWHWHEETKSGRMEQRDIVQFIEYPRQDGALSRNDMMEDAHTHAYLAGNALFGIYWAGGERRLEPRELHVEHPHGCTPVPHPTDFISRYEWDDSALFGKRSWPAKDIAHVYGHRDPNNPYWGWTMVQALATTIDADVEARKLNLKRYRRNGTPATIITDSSVRNEDDRREKEENLNRSDSDRFAAFLVLGGDQTVSPRGAMTARQLGLLEAMAFSRDEIAAGIGFLPAMFSPDAMTYDNLEHAIRHEWRLVVLRNARFSGAFGKRFIAKADRGRKIIAPDYSGVEELEDLSRKIAHVGDLVQRCRFAVNDAIQTARLNAPPQAGGDEALVAANLIPASAAAEPL